MKRNYIVLFMMVLGLVTILPATTAIEYNIATDYARQVTFEQMQSMTPTELKNFIVEALEDKLNGEEPTGLITILVGLVYTIAVSLVYIVPAFIYFLLTILL